MMRIYERYIPICGSKLKFAAMTMIREEEVLVQINVTWQYYVKLQISVQQFCDGQHFMW